jgi:hypothetical protein
MLTERYWSNSKEHIDGMWADRSKQNIRNIVLKEENINAGLRLRCSEKGRRGRWALTFPSSQYMRQHIWNILPSNARNESNSEKDADDVIKQIMYNYSKARAKDAVVANWSYRKIITEKYHEKSVSE